MHDAVFNKKAMPGPGQNVDFFAGDAAMTITQISRASLLPKDKPFDWDLVPLPRGQVGDYAIVHVGFAITRIDEAAAKEVLATLQTLELADPVLGADSNAPR